MDSRLPVHLEVNLPSLLFELRFGSLFQAVLD